MNMTATIFQSILIQNRRLLKKDYQAFAPVMSTSFLMVLPLTLLTLAMWCGLPFTSILVGNNRQPTIPSHRIEVHLGSLDLTYTLSPAENFVSDTSSFWIDPICTSSYKRTWWAWWAVTLRFLLRSKVVPICHPLFLAAILSIVLRTRLTIPLPSRSIYATKYLLYTSPITRLLNSHRIKCCTIVHKNVLRSKDFKEYFWNLFNWESDAKANSNPFYIQNISCNRCCCH